MLSTAVLVLGRSAGRDVALVKSNPGVGDCVSNQCEAARAGSKFVVARFGIQRPDKGLDAIHTTLCSPRVSGGRRAAIRT